MEKQERKVSLLLVVGIFFIPYIFGWFLLRDGHSTKARVLGLGWMAIIISMVFFGGKNTPTTQNTPTAASTVTQPHPVAPASKPSDPREIFKADARFESDELMRLIDKHFPSARYLPNNTVIVTYEAQTFVITARKLNDTDIPAIYKIVSVLPQ